MSVQDPTTRIDYREIPESEGYRFGSDGSVWSRWKQGANAPVWPWNQLSPWTHKSGHLHVWAKINSKRVNMGVHQLICWAFHGPCPEGLECCHDDGNPANNTPGNLYWGTPAQNIADQRRHGVYQRGERSGLAKLTEDKVREMRRLHAIDPKRYGQRPLARMFNISSGASGQILRGQTWRHVN